MKNLSYILLLAALFFTSCSEDPIIEEKQIDFSGTYFGEFFCEGTLSELNGEIYPVSISKDSISDSYLVDLGDDLVFVAQQDEALLTIPSQTLNQDQDFDVVTLSGLIRMREDETLSFDFSHSVDDEGMSTCQTILVNQ